MESSGRTLAVAVAAAVGGAIREWPQAGGHASFAVALPDGRVPVLVRDFGHLVHVDVTRSKSWSLRPSGDDPELDPAVLRDIAATTRAWAAPRDADHVSIFDIALDVAASLSQAHGERWTIAVPSPPDPTGMWIHDAHGEGGSVGVFDGRVIVWIGGDCREFRVAHRAELVAKRAELLEAVRTQREAHHRNVVLSTRIEAVAAALATKLALRLARACVVTTSGAPSHAGAIVAKIAFVKAPARLLVEIGAERGVVRAHAGLRGKDGWEADLDDVDAVVEPAVEAIAAAIALARRTLTIDRLAPGKRYRVLETLDGLKRGAVVRFIGFNDLDNHYGRYEFENAKGKLVCVSGDFSRPEHSPLAETHRYLVELP